jgi:hypothetical protein
MRCLWGRSRPITHFTDPSYHLRAVSRALAQFGKAVRADIARAPLGAMRAQPTCSPKSRRATDSSCDSSKPISAGLDKA